jgi:inner membrane protein
MFGGIMELFNNVYFKLSVIVIIGLLLLIPAMMVKNLIVQKESIHQDAITEVSSKWGGKQTIVGLF